MRKLDIVLIGYINSYEMLTGVRIKDAFVDKNKTVVFIVNNGEVGKAIGKRGANIKRFTNMIKKRVKVIEFNDDVEKFVFNVISPLKAEIRREGDEIILHSDETQVKALLLGRDRKNLEELNEIVNKYFKVNVSVK